MNILHLSAVKDWGGGENQIEMLCREMKKNNPDTHNLILCVRGSLFHKRLKNTKLDFLTAPLDFKIDPRFISKIISTCIKEKTELIHVHDSTSLALVVIADNLKKLPPFVFSKKTSFPIKSRKQSLYKYNYPKIKKIFCVSKATLENTAKSIEEKDKLLTIYHGVDLQEQMSSQPELNLREHLKIPSEKKIIGCIANHTRPKDLYTLVKTANQLINILNRRDFHIVQIGSFKKDRTASLKQSVKDYGLEDYFDFLGFQPNASALIPQFDISLVSSQSEGLPQFIYESFYHRVPVISTAVGGIPEIITHKTNGLLAKAHDDKKLSENILFLANNEELIPKFAEISHQMLLKNFTSEIMAEKTLTEYKNILNERL